MNIRRLLVSVTTLGVELGAKRLQLLRQIVPTVTIMALLVDPSNPGLSGPTTKSVHAAAQSLGLKLHVVHALGTACVRRAHGFRDLRGPGRHALATP